MDLFVLILVECSKAKTALGELKVILILIQVIEHAESYIKSEKNARLLETSTKTQNY